jgi:hypothetical protein
LKILIKNVIKKPGPVGAGLVPVQSGRCRSVPVGAAGAGVADRPQETLYLKSFKNILTSKIIVDISDVLDKWMWWMWLWMATSIPTSKIQNKPDAGDC